VGAGFCLEPLGEGEREREQSAVPPSVLFSERETEKR
jgi:hypothetical protein